jgi:glucose-1-phosphate cytidylyltransferase
MKAVILAGGLGTRISEETNLKPKPMVEIGGLPILWHVMKIYSAFGINDFVICVGYKGYVIKEYFANYFLHRSDITFDMKHNRMEVHEKHAEPWRVTIIDTGEKTMTGGRLRRVREYVGDGSFCFTYGDGVANIDISLLLAFHKRQKTRATLTGVQPPGRFGALDISGDQKISTFKEKPMGDGSWVNGGFFVLEPDVFELLRGDDDIWEKGPLESLANSGQLSVYKHSGFWQPMDTLRDRILLETLWTEGRAPWRIWS